MALREAKDREYKRHQGEGGKKEIKKEKNRKQVQNRAATRAATPGMLACIPLLRCRWLVAGHPGLVRSVVGSADARTKERPGIRGEPRPVMAPDGSAR